MGEEVVQVYVSVPHSNIERPLSELKSFKRVAVEPKSVTTAEIDICVHDLAYFDEGLDEFVVEPADYIFTVAKFSGDPNGISIRASILERSLIPE
ncbi:fibronectin type III-like domain-contianing protein [Microbulbifer sp. SH-1]|uniref:fibronectin type III-like domain-contianing protein n=1 Tax=Microbulbifer sp. SH-1 TaxID=2681547 RepID=UPI001F10455D|nr:fibronectin type III-like domain-contianing protein [Microbulbifer sp. SH-1]